MAPWLKGNESRQPTGLSHHAPVERLRSCVCILRNVNGRNQPKRFIVLNDESWQPSVGRPWTLLSVQANCTIPSLDSNIISDRDLRCEYGSKQAMQAIHN